MVATIQLAITLGASLGGFAFDASGYQSTFVLSAIVLGAGALLAHKAGLATQGAREAFDGVETPDEQWKVGLS